MSGGALPSLDPALRGALALGLSGLLVCAALPKLRRPGRFTAAVAGYALLPERLTPLAAGALLALELLLGVGLAAGAAGAAELGAPALAAAALFGLYGAAIASALRRGRRDLDCGCSFGSPRPLEAGLLWRNGVLCLACLACALPASARSAEAVDALTIAAGGAGLLLLYAAVDAAWSNAARLAGLRALR